MMYTEFNIQTHFKKSCGQLSDFKTSPVAFLILLKCNNWVNLASYTNVLRAKITCK